MKTCKCCNLTFEIVNFHKDKKSKDNLSSICKTCKSLKDKEYRKKNDKKLKEKFKTDYYKNHEQSLIKAKERYHSASDEVKQKRRQKKQEYNKTAPDKVKQRKKEYDKKYFASEAGKLTTAKSVHKRRAQKITTEDGTVTSQALEDLKKQQEYKCKYCSCDLDFTDKGRVHLDHVVPLSKGGVHTITNLVWSCASCNLKKSNKLIINI